MTDAVARRVEALRTRLLETGQLEQLRVSTPRDDLVVINLIQVPTGLHCNGIGTDALHALTDAADRNGWVLAGTPDTSFGSSRAGLDRLYRRFGFISNRGRRADFTISESLVRRPHPAAISPAANPPDLNRAAALESTTRRAPDRLKVLPNMTTRPPAPRR